MAVARKVIVLDFTKLEAMEILALAAVVMALGFTYGWVAFRSRSLNERTDTVTQP